MDGILIAAHNILPILVSLVWGSIGYAVARTKNNEKFDPKNFITAIVIGFAANALSLALNKTPDDPTINVIVSALIPFADKIAGLFAKKAIK